jgi:hypothetical protein
MSLNPPCILSVLCVSVVKLKPQHIQLSKLTHYHQNPLLDTPTSERIIE